MARSVQRRCPHRSLSSVASGWIRSAVAVRRLAPLFEVPISLMVGPQAACVDIPALYREPRIPPAESGGRRFASRVRSRSPRFFGFPVLWLLRCGIARALRGLADRSLCRKAVLRCEDVGSHWLLCSGRVLNAPGACAVACFSQLFCHCFAIFCQNGCCGNLGKRAVAGVIRLVPRWLYFQAQVVSVRKLPCLPFFCGCFKSS